MFGIKMGDEVGGLVYSAWITLFRAGMVTPEDIAYAMVEGSLPQYFEDNVRNLDFEDESFYAHGRRPG